MNTLGGIWEAARKARYRLQGLQYGALYPPANCHICGAQLERIPPEALPPHARRGPSMWRCPNRGDVAKHPLPEA